MYRLGIVVSSAVVTTTLSLISPTYAEASDCPSDLSMSTDGIVGKLISCISALQDEISALKEPNALATTIVPAVAREIVESHSDVLPAGKKGEPGDAGPVGPKGDRGEPGAQGKVGPSGKFDIPKGAIVAFDLPSGCPNGWTDVGKTDPARFAGRMLVAVGIHENREPQSYGNIGGAEKHQLTTAEMPGHVHSLNHGDEHTSDLPNHGYSVSAYGTMSVGPVAGTAVGGDHNNMPPYIALHFCKYVGDS